jgi:tRNA threonylcarbamoyladenosine biosynthesis protein TsaB
VTILGIDTSTAVSSACVLRGDDEAFELVPDPAALTAPPRHARELMPAIARVLDEAGVKYGDLDAIAVGVGPGAFTGLRIGVATARALAKANDLALRPVSSLAALAAGAGEPRVLAAIDAKRGELFAALYDDGRAVWGPVAEAPNLVAAHASEGDATPLAVGDGSVRFREVLEAAGLGVAPDGSSSHIVSALQICRLADGVPAQPPETVLPDYLREPDAKPQ